MQVYTPNTILIPQEIKGHPVISSYLIHYFQQIAKLPSGRVTDYFAEDVSLDQLLTLEEQKEYLSSGNYPLFHDIFLREYRGGQQVVCIAPQESEIAHFIGDPEVWHNGEQIVPDKITKRSDFYGIGTGMSVINSDTELQFRAGDILELRWTKPDFSFTRKVELQPYLWRDDRPKLTLNTLQKDEPLEWIRDWVLYYHRIHGVERILLYDNNSESRSALMEFLPQLESETLEICLIPWDINYSPFLLSYCQYGQLSHAYYWLWDKTSWDINCDIDEYLINRTSKPLTRYLKRYAHSSNPVLAFPCHTVSAYSEGNTDDESRLPLLTDFTWITPPLATRGKKIMAGGRRIICLDVHIGFHGPTPKSYLLRLLKSLFLRKEQHKIPTDFGKPRRYLNALSYRYHRLSHQDPTPIRISFVERCFLHTLNIFSSLPKYIFVYRRKEWGLYFYHYWGLNANARSMHGGLQASKREGDYQDTDILKLFKRAGIGKYYSP